MGCFNKYDIAGCGCVSCSPCPLPAANLTATWHNTVTGLTKVLALTYTPGTPFDFWLSGSCVPIATGTTAHGSFAIACRNDGTACTAYHAVEWNDVGCTIGQADSAYQDPANCDSIAWAATWTLQSATCSPLSIVIKRGTANTITITP